MTIGTMPSTMANSASVRSSWHIVDATEQSLGRLAVKIAHVLMGKHKPIYTPHVDTGDFVVVTNVEKLSISAKKLDAGVYPRYTYHPGGYKEIPMRKVFDERPDRVLYEAVRRMMPKNAIGRRMLKKLKLYRGDKHPHSAQQPSPWAF